MMEKPAPTDRSILEVIKRRWSPRAFDSRPIEHTKIRTMLEAARWAPSSFNEQPWRFILARKEDPPQFDKALGCLAPGNQEWARYAPLLILTVVKKTFSRNAKPNRMALHDLGLAAANLTLQATELGLFVHQIAGIDLDAVHQRYSLAQDFEPATAIVVGYAYPAEPTHLPDWVQHGEIGERVRKPLTQIVFDGRWGQASELLAEV